MNSKESSGSQTELGYREVKGVQGYTHTKKKKLRPSENEQWSKCTLGGWMIK